MIPTRGLIGGHDMPRTTVKGIYENGEIKLVEPVPVTGTWYVDVTFIEEVKTNEDILEPNPHRPETPPIDETYEEFHRKIEPARMTHRTY